MDRLTRVSIEAKAGLLFCQPITSGFGKEVFPYHQKGFAAAGWGAPVAQEDGTLPRIESMQTHLSYFYSFQDPPGFEAERKLDLAFHLQATDLVKNTLLITMTDAEREPVTVRVPVFESRVAQLLACATDAAARVYRDDYLKNDRETRYVYSLDEKSNHEDVYRSKKDILRMITESAAMATDALRVLRLISPPLAIGQSYTMNQTPEQTFRDLVESFWRRRTNNNNQEDGMIGYGAGFRVYDVPSLATPHELRLCFDPERSTTENKNLHIDNAWVVAEKRKDPFDPEEVRYQRVEAGDLSPAGIKKLYRVLGGLPLENQPQAQNGKNFCDSSGEQRRQRMLEAAVETITGLVPELQRAMKALPNPQTARKSDPVCAWQAAASTTGVGQLNLVPGIPVSTWKIKVPHLST